MAIENLEKASSVEQGVSVLSYTHKRVSHDFDHDHEHKHDHHTSTRFNPTRHRVGSFASGTSWTLRHTGESRQDTHDTPVPEREGLGPQLVPRLPTNDNRRRQNLRQMCFQETCAGKRETEQPGSCEERESQGILKMDLQASQHFLLESSATPRHVGLFEKRTAGVWHVLALQEANQYICSEIQQQDFWGTAFTECATLLTRKLLA